MRGAGIVRLCLARNLGALLFLFFALAGCQTGPSKPSPFPQIKIAEPPSSAQGTGYPPDPFNPSSIAKADGERFGIPLGGFTPPQTITSAVSWTGDVGDGLGFNVYGSTDLLSWTLLTNTAALSVELTETDGAKFYTVSATNGIAETFSGGSIRFTAHQ